MAERGPRVAVARGGEVAGARANAPGGAVPDGGAREPRPARLTGALAAIFGISNSLGYLLPAIIGLESMGVPSPGETALILAAVLASAGKLQIWLVIVIAAASAILGDNAGYWLGRRFGRDVLEAPRGP